MKEDAELLRRYAAGHSDAAFAELAGQHVNQCPGRDVLEADHRIEIHSGWHPFQFGPFHPAVAFWLWRGKRQRLRYGRV
jgi:hypothetical protein